MRKLITALLIIASLCSINAYAGVQEENAEPARISNILNAVYPLIDAAKTQANPNSRLKFRYDWLKQDIQNIQMGIAQKINKTRLVPQLYTPLKSNFTVQTNTQKGRAN